ncbi:MAG: CPXCG motif-containing cysteine-rich protein [Fibrobacteria bacterium]|jgi:hypothetical protein
MDGLRDFTSPCPYCGERQKVEIDMSDPLPQEFINDCTVCCRPIVVRVTSGSRGEPVMRLQSEEETV